MHDLERGMLIHEREDKQKVIGLSRNMKKLQYNEQKYVEEQNTTGRSMRCR